MLCIFYNYNDMFRERNYIFVLTNHQTLSSSCLHLLVFRDHLFTLTFALIMALVVVKDMLKQSWRFGMRAEQRSLEHVQIDRFVFHCRIHSGQTEIDHYELVRG